MTTDEELAERIVDSVLNDSDGDLAAVLAETQERPRALRLAAKQLAG